MTRPRLLLVTGRLAEPALRRIVSELAASADFDFEIAVLPITVVALATTEWIARHLQIPQGIERVILPGLCSGALESIQALTNARIERGPKDLRQLPEYFGSAPACPTGYGDYDIEILAEINLVPRLSWREILDQASRFRTAGADIIDLGCEPGTTWNAATDTVRALRAEGFRVSIDSMNSTEIDAAVAGGAELVLSVNSTNVAEARSWGCEVIAVPDVPATLQGLDGTVEQLAANDIAFRIDPILEPIGFEFAASLGRYLETRRRYPRAPMMMGVGNLTELTDVDSAGVNVLLLGFCQELGIRSVLTTEAINWCRSAVAELDRARRLVHYACTEHVLPKHLEKHLVMLRDPRLYAHGEETLRDLSRQIGDPNIRLFAERGVLHAMNAGMYVQGTDPFELFAEIQKRQAIDPAHAFYLGYELAKAVTALTLGKNYVQDQALRWGLLTAPEKSHQARMKHDGS